LKKDTPNISETISVFIAKLVECEIFSSDGITLLGAKNSDKNEITKQCIDDAIALINNRHLLQGKCIPCGGHQSLAVLSAQFKLILKEYLLSNDVDTAEKRLSNLKVPHFNHEFVYQASVLALEEMHDNLMTKLADLIKHMSENGIIAESCIHKGYTRLFDGLNDLFLDLPGAYTLAKRWVDKSLKAGVISKDLTDLCPRVRGRTRTLSQGPDGKLSCMDDVDESKNETPKDDEESK